MFGPQLYQDGELPDKKIEEFLRKIRKIMKEDPENGLKNKLMNLIIKNHNKYLMNNNGARNFALQLGKQLSFYFLLR